MKKSVNNLTRIKGPTTFVDSKRIIDEFNVTATTFCEIELYNQFNNEYKINLSVENGICIYNNQVQIFKAQIDEAETVIRLASTLIKDSWFITPITTKVNCTYKDHAVGFFFGSGVGDWYEINGPECTVIAREFGLPIWDEDEFNDLALYTWKDTEAKSLLRDGDVNRSLKSLLNKIKSVEYNISLKRIKSRLVSYDNDFTKIEDIYFKKTKVPLLSHECNKEVILKSKISIIIPYYDTGDGVIGLLSSLNGQWITPESYKNIQVIVVDDGSKGDLKLSSIDSSSYKYNLNIVRHNTNKGTSATRNTGASYADGDVIIFLDSDCMPHPSFVGEHWLRNSVCDNCLFIGLKHDVLALDEISNVNGSFFDYCNDYRKYKNINPDWLADKRIADWAHNNQRSLQTQNGEYRILEITNNLKDFSKYGWYGWWDLASVVISHSISMRKETFKSIGGFSYSFKGWGYEDAFFGACAIALGVYIIPVLSSGVYHIEHEPRSGSKAQKRGEKMQNELIYAKLLDMRVSELNPSYMYS